ncbi:MAG: hypothetical protein QUS13_14230, partial [Smithella sp.]|nr:hypothetical protein [Smithella sp.]
MFNKTGIIPFIFIALFFFLTGCDQTDSTPLLLGSDDNASAGGYAITVDPAGRVSGSFTTLTYNIAGLLEPFSGSNPSVYTPVISCLIRDYDIVQVQEDFN